MSINSLAYSGKTGSRMNSDLDEPQNNIWAPDLVIYHDKCADGIVAAWVCWKRWGDAPEYRAMNYGYAPPADVTGLNILMVDFSLPAEQLHGMIAAGARSIVILDHHKTAQAALEPFQVFKDKPERFTPAVASGMISDLTRGDYRPIIALFDMDRSGARMAWDFAYPGERVPQLVRLAERYDLWQFQPNTGDPAEQLHLAIQAGTMSIADMDALDQEFWAGDAPLRRGAIIDTFRQPLIREIAARAHYRTVGGVECVIAVECPYSLVSAVGHYLLDAHPAAPFAAMSVTGENAVGWSLRSHDDRMDVSEVAKGQGGGGHRNAAGFRVEIEPVSNPHKLPDFLTELRRVNGERYVEWTGGTEEDPLYMSNEFGGEAGEVQNVVKKLVREQRGWVGSRSSVEALGEEIGDCIICLDSVARVYGLDLAEATAAKFNKTSAANGFAQRLNISHATSFELRLD